MTPAKLVTRTYSWRDVDRLVDLLVGRIVARQSYLDAMRWAVRWSHDPIVLQLLYGRRRTIFERWLQSLGLDDAKQPQWFTTNVLANVIPNRRVVVDGSVQAPDKPGLARRMRQPYMRSLAALVNATPVGSLPALVEVTGQERLVEAHRRGKGVILLSAHGLPGPGTLLPVERLLALERIPTISWRTPRRQSRFAGTSDEVSQSISDTLNTEVALYSARQLQAGRIIQILNDSPDRQGRTYAAAIAGRQYQFKAGFAELALDTGAEIVPHARTCLPDGTIRYAFAAPLEYENSDRSRSIEALIQQYAAFLENTWTTHPESIRWSKMQKHFRYPVATDAG